MLSTIGLREPQAGYYLADHLNELPLELGPRPSGWWGRQAQAFGLEGPAPAASVEALCAGELLGGPATGRRTVLAYDLTFAAPKEASLLLAAGDGRAVALLKAHGLAVGAGLRYLEDHAASVVVGAGDTREVARASGLALHASTHATSRAGDPHLHTHCLVANLGHGPDGRFRALDGRGLRAHARAADALYRAELGFQLNARLVAGRSDVDQELRLELRGAFSSRAAELAQGGRRAAARPSEARSVQVERWRTQLHHLGVDPGGDQLVVNALEPPRRRVAEHQLAAALLGDDRRRGRRDGVEAWAKAAGPVPAVQVERCVDLLLGPEALGVGVDEPVLMPRRLLAPARALERLGARPVDPRGLEHWLRRSLAIGRERGRDGIEPPGRTRARA